MKTLLQNKTCPAYIGKCMGLTKCWIIAVLGIMALPSCYTRTIGDVPMMTVRPVLLDGRDSCYVDTSRQISATYSCLAQEDDWVIFKAAEKAVENAGSDCVGVANAKVIWKGSVANDGTLGAVFAKTIMTVNGNPVYRR